jgi:hypothetical protein
MGGSQQHGHGLGGWPMERYRLDRQLLVHLDMGRSRMDRPGLVR